MSINDTSQNQQEKIYKNLLQSKADKFTYLLKELPNGLKALIISDPETNKSCAGLGVKIGSLSDPKDCQGLAHFCEHLLFMGTKKYPDENEYDDFITKNSGYTNAFTSENSTIFYFDVANDVIEEALERFAQFFICPIFNESSVQKEINAINSEFTGTYHDDDERKNQLIFSESNPKSVFNHFSCGNIETLNLPDIRNRLLNMHNKYYSSNIMSLCIYNNKSIEELSKIIDKLFIQIPKIENLILPKYDEILPYDDSNLHILYKIVPIENKNKIKFAWFLPFCKNYYANVSNYLSSLFGHEGENTLTSSLKRNNYINYLESGCLEVGEIGYEFYIEVTLSPLGFENYKEVMIIVFNYIKKIQSEGVNERFFKEYQQINQILFDYKDKKDPDDYVKECIDNLFKYKPEDCLVGNSLYREYNPELINKYINLLTIDKCNIYFSSKFFEKECTLSEKWYKTKYIKEKFPITQEEVDKYVSKNPIGYPPENIFIPRDLSVYPIENIEKYPKKILENKNSNVYFLQDSIFNLPKAIIGLIIYLPENLCDNSKIKNDVLGELLTKAVNFDINETIYLAEEVEFKQELKINSRKISIEVSGFNDSIQKVLEIIINSIKNIDFDSEKQKNKFDLYHDELQKEYINSYLEKDKIIMKYLKYNLCENYNTPNEYISFLETNNDNSLLLSELKKFQKNIFNNIKTEWLIQGNLTEKISLEIVNKINTLINLNSDKNNSNLNYAIKRNIQIPNKTNFIFSFDNPNKNETESVIISAYQLGQIQEEDAQYLKIAESFLSEKFYDRLRTNETLGYAVYCYSEKINSILYFLCFIQGDNKNSEFCAERIRQFFKDKENEIINMTEEEFQTYVTSNIIEYQKKDHKLKKIFDRNWKEIRRQRYMFDYRERYVENLKKCEREKFIEFYKKYFIYDVAKIDCEYISESHKNENEKLMKDIKNIDDNGIERVIIDNNNGNEWKKSLGFYPPILKQ